MSLRHCAGPCLITRELTIFSGNAARDMKGPFRNRTSADAISCSRRLTDTGKLTSRFRDRMRANARVLIIETFLIHSRSEIGFLSLSGSRAYLLI